jgi:hypothetical protein
VRRRPEDFPRVIKLVIRSQTHREVLDGTAIVIIHRLRYSIHEFGASR